MTGLAEITLGVDGLLAAASTPGAVTCRPATANYQILACRRGNARRQATHLKATEQAMSNAKRKEPRSNASGKQQEQCTAARSRSDAKRILTLPLHVRFRRGRGAMCGGVQLARKFMAFLGVGIKAIEMDCLPARRRVSDMATFSAVDHARERHGQNFEQSLTPKLLESHLLPQSQRMVGPKGGRFRRLTPVSPVAMCPGTCCVCGRFITNRSARASKGHHCIFGT